MRHRHTLARLGPQVVTILPTTLRCPSYLYPPSCAPSPSPADAPLGSSRMLPLLLAHAPRSRSLIVTRCQLRVHGLTRLLSHPDDAGVGAGLHFLGDPDQLIPWDVTASASSSSSSLPAHQMLIPPGLRRRLLPGAAGRSPDDRAGLIRGFLAATARARVLSRVLASGAVGDLSDSDFELLMGEDDGATGNNNSGSGSSGQLGLSAATSSLAPSARSTAGAGATSSSTAAASSSGGGSSGASGAQSLFAQRLNSLPEHVALRASTRCVERAIGALRTHVRAARDGHDAPVSNGLVLSTPHGVAASHPGSASAALPSRFRGDSLRFGASSDGDDGDQPAESPAPGLSRRGRRGSLGAVAAFSSSGAASAPVSAPEPRPRRTSAAGVYALGAAPQASTSSSGRGGLNSAECSVCTGACVCGEEAAAAEEESREASQPKAKRARRSSASASGAHDVDQAPAHTEPSSGELITPLMGAKGGSKRRRVITAAASTGGAGSEATLSAQSGRLISRSGASSVLTAPRSSAGSSTAPPAGTPLTDLRTSASSRTLAALRRHPVGGPHFREAHDVAALLAPLRGLSSSGGGAVSSMLRGACAWPPPIAHLDLSMNMLTRDCAE